VSCKPVHIKTGVFTDVVRWASPYWNRGV